MSLAPLPIQREAAPLRAQAVDYLRSAIVTGAYAPGSRLIEKNLCEELSVSRTVIRESLRQLETERLVDIKPNIGPIVHLLTRQEAANLYEVRASLEALAGRLAARNATREQVARLREVVSTIASETQAAPLASTLKLKNSFYATLVEASNNPTIGELFDNVQARISELRSLTLRQDGRPAAMVIELNAIVEAIAAGDEEAASRLCQQHVEAASDIALSALDEG